MRLPSRKNGRRRLEETKLTSVPRRRWLAKTYALAQPLAVISLISIMLFSAALEFSTPLHHDVLWYLIAARTFIQGGTLYKTVIDPNPPFIVLFSLISILLADLLVISADFAFRLLVFAVTGLSLFLTWSLLARIEVLEQVERLLLLISTAWILTAAAHPYFGQREHLLIVFSLPYLVIVMGRSLGLAAPLPLYIVAGAMMALGICMKPFYLLPFLMGEIAALGKAQCFITLFRRPDLLTAGIVGFIYTVTVMVLWPEYYRVVIPLVRDTYGAYSVSSWTQIVYKRQVFELVLVPFLCVRSPMWRGLRALPQWHSVPTFVF